MLGFQTHSQGSTASLSLFAARDYNQVLPRYNFLDGKQDLQNDHSLLTQPSSPWTSLLQDLAATGYPKLDACTTPRQEGPCTTTEMSTSHANFVDLPRLVDIEFAAFRFEKVNHHLSYRDGTDAAHIRRTLLTYRKYMNNLRSTVDPDRLHSSKKIVPNASVGFKFRKVTLPGSGEIIAFCKSEILALNAEDLSSPLDIGHESEPQMNRDWFALNEKLHRQYCGTKMHCYFGMLATHPDFQHRGAASKLMDELITEADQLGLEIYCEATKTGRPLYEKYGFVAVKEIVFPTVDYGVDLGVEYQTVMVRGALGKDGKRGRVRSWDQAVAESALVFPDR